MLLAVVVFATTLGAAAFAVGQPAADRVNVLLGFHGPLDLKLVERFGGKVSHQFGFIRAVAAQLPPQAIEALSRNPNVRYIEPDAEVYATSQTVPWGIDRVFAGSANRGTTWGKSTGSAIKVAILDTGIDKSHEDLAGIVMGGTTTVDSTPWYSDGNGHGTHVAGTVAAQNNTLGVVGVAPSAHLYGVKVLSDSGSGSLTSVVAGIEWAANNGMQIINMSLGTSSHSQAMQDAVDYAYYTKGLLVVSSAGNSGNVRGTGDNVGYPARYASVIAVAASTSSNTRASFSSTGPAVELIAPGASILSTTPKNTYSTYSGTSMASPHVAGVAALVWAANPGLTAEGLRITLQQTAQNLGLKPDHQGYGLVRADLAVDKALEGVSPPPPPPAAETYTVSGTVRDDASNVVDGAQVVIQGTQVSAITNADGYYSITGVLAGDYTVVVSKEGYVSFSQAVQVSGDTTVNFILSATTAENLIGAESITFTPKNAGRFIDLSIVVYVKDSAGLSVANATVTLSLTGPVNTTFTGTTGSDGRVTFTVKKASKGTYIATATGITHSTLKWDGKETAASFTLK
jgi:subtilisin family serine protease